MLWVSEMRDAMYTKSQLNRKSSRLAMYQIRVEGKLDEAWSDWLNGVLIELESEVPPVTSLTGEITDQASLRGLMNQIWDLNLSLISVKRMEE
jgi:hypothetical protein